MRPSQLLSPELKRGTTWHIEWYFERDGKRLRIRKSRFEKIDLNAIADLREREVVAQRLLADLKARLLPPVEQPAHTPFLVALQIAVELKRSNKWKTNKSLKEVTRWVSEFFESKGWQHLRCNQVEQRHIQDYFDYIIVKRRVANTTHNSRKNNLRALMTELVKRAYIPTNFASQVPERPEADPIRRPLSQQEKEVLAKHIFATDRALSLAFVLIGYLAIRPGEIRDLRVGAIDLVRGFVRFPARDSKNNRDSTVTIPAKLFPMLNSLKLEQYPPSFYLFGAGKGRHNSHFMPGEAQIGANTLSLRFRNVVRQLHQEGKLHNIKGVQLYSLKDSLAIYLLDQGVNVQSAMEHFRHSDLAVFQRYVKRLGLVNEPIRSLEIDLVLPK